MDHPNGIPKRTVLKWTTHTKSYCENTIYTLTLDAPPLFSLVNAIDFSNTNRFLSYR